MEVLFLIIIIVLILFFLTKTNKLKEDVKNYETDNQHLKEALNAYKTRTETLTIEKDALIEKNQKLRLHNNELIIYQDILDIQAECERIKRNNDLLCDQLRSEWFSKIQQADEDAKTIRREANEFAKRKSNEISLLYDSALKESQRIVENAEKRAENIGGDAYRSLREADRIAETIKAMKNVIQGYGNEYIIPTYTILDDLEQEYSHKDAGIELKKLRQNNKKLITERKAAECDYVDPERRKTAIDFVLDAYTGKVDSILSGVKKDNYGILLQKINDAFVLVNFNGKAFRNARITTEFHEAKIEELRLAVILQELKALELEEQREIREQIREEERARREFEKAIREAEKEEQTLKKLIEKAQSQVAKANEEQKLLFEEKLRELEEKLVQAEEKNQRAISMAQQTRRGNVYIISNIGSFGEDVFKIGMTRRLEPLDRVKELGDASVPFEFDVHAMIYSDDAPALERQLHRKFLNAQLNKINPRKEFFRISLNELKSFVDEIGIDTKWTLKAEARQYRETLKLEEEMKNNEELREQWEDYQEELDPVTFEEIIEE